MLRFTGLTVTLLALAFAAPASATDMAVTTHADVLSNDGQCSLREAVAAANFNVASGDLAGECPAGGGGADRVQLETGTYLLSRPGARENGNATGDLDVTAGTLIVTGRGLATKITAAGIDRALDVVTPTAIVRLESLTVTESAAPAGADATAPTEAGGAGEHGGGVRNAGILEVVDSAVTDNAAGAGGAGMGGTPGSAGGAGGNGGGIYSNGVLGMTRTVVSGNLAGAGGAGGNGAPGGAGGAGGGIAASGNFFDSRIADNAAGSGGRGGDGCDGGQGGAGGPGGGGGGIDAPVLGLRSSVVAANRAGNGGGGGVGPGCVGGRGGAGGSGGGVATGSAPEVASTLLEDNTAGNGGGGGFGFGFGGNGGPGGSAGGLLADGSAAVFHVTITAGAAGSGGPGGSGVGTSGAAGANGQGSAVSGTGAAHFTSTILEGSCSGAIVDDGANLKSSNAGCPGALANVLLGPGAVPQVGSPAIDGGPETGCTVRDPLGTSRPQGARCDIGAIEVPAAPLTLSHSALAFAPIAVGAGSRFLTVNVLNKGLPGLALPISVTGGPDFEIAAESCPDVLRGGTDCDVIVLFTPSQAGERTGTLQLADRVVGLSGTGVAPPDQSQPTPTPTPTPKKCIVPKLKGKTIAAARRALVAANCRLGTVRRSGRGRVGRIRAFKPKAGSQLDAGARVDVTVNRLRARARR
jgi:CSLREA domain-containing protein